NPAAVNCGELACLDFPVCGEAAEVIDAHHVGEAERGANARHPPSISRVAQDIPAIKRIAPTLSRLAEIVGWNAGDDGGRARFVELEELAIGPNVGTVRSDVDRHVAHNVDVALVGGAADGSPLREEEPLHVLVKANFF